jgi:osmoprotectant transport system permease protein
VGFIGDVIQFIRDNWSGPNGILDRTIEHLQISVISVLIAMAIALPPAIWLGHIRRGGALAVNTANIGRALPSFAVLVLAYQFTDEIGAVPTVIALVALAVPPIFTNAYIGISEVDDEVREAASGMGMKGTQVLRRVELPLSLPLIMAGIRTSAVQVVATATLATLIGWGGLGFYIIVGLRLNNFVEAFAGALMVTLLAFALDGILAVVQRLLVPRGIGGGAGRWETEIAVETEVDAAEAATV